MNELIGTIVDIKHSGNLSLVSIETYEVLIKSILIFEEDYARFIAVGNKIKLLFKETELIIATEKISTISLHNGFSGAIIRIDEGELLTRVVFDFKGNLLSAVITSDSSKRLDLCSGATIWGYIKTNEIILSEL
jgi:molybdate transport system regulatory protein